MFSKKSSHIDSSATAQTENSNNKEDKFQSDSGVVDSGFISSEVTDTFLDDDEYDRKSESEFKEPSQKKDDNQQQQQQQKKFTNTEDYLDSGLVEDTEIEEEEEEEHCQQSSSTPMLVEKNFDVGLSDCFKNLKLRNQDENIQVNNLDSSAKKLPQKQQPQKQPWQIYYQQNNEGDTFLHLAVIHEVPNAVATLVKIAVHPCLFDIQNDMLQTALHLAVLTKQPSQVRKLVVAGANLELRDRYGNTALHLACANGEFESVRNLLLPLSSQELRERPNNAKPFKQQDLEQWNYDGEKCVHLACKNNQLEILKCLVKHGADINARDGKSGWTALHFAIEQNNESMANFIMECPKTNVETETYAKLTAYQLAAITHNENLLNHLLKRGAEPLSVPSDSEEDSDDDFYIVA